MKIEQIITKRVVENKGLVGFASCVVSGIKLNNIAIFKRLGKETYRLVFPEKKIGESKVQIFFPITNEAYLELEEAISKAFK